MEAITNIAQQKNISPVSILLTVYKFLTKDNIQFFILFNKPFL